MGKAKRKADERLARRREAYDDSVKNLKTNANTSGYHRPGSRKK